MSFVFFFVKSVVGLLRCVLFHPVHNFLAQPKESEGAASVCDSRKTIKSSRLNSVEKFTYTPTSLFKLTFPPAMLPIIRAFFGAPTIPFGPSKQHLRFPLVCPALIN